MPSEHTLIFISSILELLVLLFVAYEVVVGEIRHRRAAMANHAADAPAVEARRRMSVRLGLFISFISLAIWMVVYLTYDAGPSFLSLKSSEPDTGQIVWNFEQTARGAGFFLTMQKLTDQPEIRVISFGAKGKNNSNKPISKFSGYLRSEQTNVPIPIYLLAQEPDESKIIACFPHPWIPTLAEETFGIPAFADFEISTSEKPFIETGKDGIPLSKFMNDFVPFTIVLEYDGTKYERRFTTEEVKNQVTFLERSFAPQSNPRVTRRPNAKPASPLPLQTLLSANPPKAPPGLASPIPSTGLPKLPAN